MPSTLQPDLPRSSESLTALTATGGRPADPEMGFRPTRPNAGHNAISDAFELKRKGLISSALAYLSKCRTLSDLMLSFTHHPPLTKQSAFSMLAIAHYLSVLKGGRETVWWVANDETDRHGQVPPANSLRPVD